MKNTELRNALMEAELIDHIDFVESLFGPAIQIKPIADNSKTTLSSIGGTPKLPKGFGWPKHDRGLHSLVLTIGCSELPQNSNFPLDGVVYVFAAHDPGGDSWFWEDDFIKVYHFKSDELITEESIDVPTFNRIPILFENKVSLPFNSFLREDWPWPEDDHDLFEFTLPEYLNCDLVDDSGDFLLGNAPGGRLLYNPLPDENWQLLAFIRSHNNIGMYWGDDSALMIFIEKEALKNNDFENIKCEIG